SGQRTLDDPQRRTRLGAGTEHCVVRGKGPRERLARVRKLVRVELATSPDMDRLVSAEGLPRFYIFSSDQKRIEVGRCLAKGVLDAGTLSRALHAFTAGMHQKVRRKDGYQGPLFRRHASKAEKPAGLRKLRRPALRGEVERIGRKTHHVVAGWRREFVGNLQGMSFANLPELIEAKFRIARVIGRNMVRERRSVPGKRKRRGMVATARQADVERIQRLVAGILKAVLGSD